jgi:hypothetical protein
MIGRLSLIAVVATLVAASGCEQIWNGPNDPQPSPYEARRREEELQQERHDRQHVAQQDSDFRKSLRNGGVSGDY